VWPPVRIGHVQTKQYGNKTLQLETLSLQPLVLSISHFLEPHECEKIISMADGRMRNSGVSHMDHDKGKAAKVVHNDKSIFAVPPLRHPLIRFASFSFLFLLFCKNTPTHTHTHRNGALLLRRGLPPVKTQPYKPLTSGWPHSPVCRHHTRRMCKFSATS
jgi:hypothetical protein